MKNQFGRTKEIVPIETVLAKILTIELFSSLTCKYIFPLQAGPLAVHNDSPLGLLLELQAASVAVGLWMEEGNTLYLTLRLRVLHAL